MFDQEDYVWVNNFLKVAFLSGKCQNCLGELFADVMEEVSCQLMVQAGRQEKSNCCKIGLLEIVIILESSLGPPLKIPVGAWAVPTHILVWIVCKETRKYFMSLFLIKPSEKYTAPFINTSRNILSSATRSSVKPEDHSVICQPLDWGILLLLTVERAIQSLPTVYFKLAYYFRYETDKVLCFPCAFWPVNSLQPKPESSLRGAQGEM